MLKNKHIFIIIALFFAHSLFAQDDWGASDEQKTLQLQIKFNSVNINGGEALFKSQCSSCHGDLGANSPKLATAPDIGSLDFHKNNSDGLIFYKISEGNAAKAMPPFKSTLSEEEIWKVITYIRNSWNEYEPPSEITAASPTESSAEAFEGKLTKIEFEADETDYKLSAKLIGENSNGQRVYVPNIPLEFKVVGHFGDLSLNPNSKTNENGEINFDFPKDLPSDTAGNIMLYAAVPATAGYGDVKSEVLQVKMGEKLNWTPPLSKRSLWGTMANTPLWLLFTYLGITGFVWLGIFYVVLQLLKIWMLREK